MFGQVRKDGINTLFQETAPTPNAYDDVKPEDFV